MISITKLAGLSNAASCLLGASSAVVLPSVSPVVRERSERPTQAPAAAAVRAYACVATTNGAGNQQWMGGGFAGVDSAAVTKHQNMRAFRGLSPWRDPA
ncbi:hypothetical protein ACFW9F_28550 [Streptomyces sp. NPDC059506]|uniref:hypothetical protein n=1 Tax=Streptomyces sp. NPDC059506 TaxID=3347751 RepID=UPI00367EE5EA